MNRCKLFLITLVALLLATAWPVQAQDSGTGLTREEMVATVVAAFDNLRASQYYGFEGTVTESQVLTSGQGIRMVSLHRSAERTLEGRVQVGVAGAPDNVETSVQQSERSFINGQSQNARTLDTAFELMLVDGQLYVQVVSIQGTLNAEAISSIRDEASRQVIQNQFAQPFWINVTENPDDLAGRLSYLDSANTSGSFFDSLSLEALATSNSSFRLTAAMILDIRQEPDENANEQVFVVTLNPAQVLATLGLSNLFETSANIDVEELLQQLFAGATITQTIRVTTNSDNQPVLSAITTQTNINAVFTPETTAGLGFTVQTETTTRVTYRNLGRAFELEAPDTTPPAPPATEEGETSS